MYILNYVEARKGRNAKTKSNKVMLQSIAIDLFFNLKYFWYKNPIFNIY